MKSLQLVGVLMMAYHGSAIFDLTFLSENQEMRTQLSQAPWTL